MSRLADTIEEALKHLGVPEAELRRVSPNWAANLVRFLTHPIVSSLLITIGMLGIILEIRTPGFGVPGVLGISSIAFLLGATGWSSSLAGRSCCWWFPA